MCYDLIYKKSQFMTVLSIVNLDKDNLFNRLVEKEGMKLYG